MHRDARAIGLGLRRAAKLLGDRCDGVPVFLEGADRERMDVHVLRAACHAALEEHRAASERIMRMP